MILFEFGKNNDITSHVSSMLTFQHIILFKGVINLINAIGCKLLCSLSEKFSSFSSIPDDLDDLATHES